MSSEGVNQSGQAAIAVRGLSKCYPLYNKPLHRVLDLLLPGESRRFSPFWALKNISFEVLPGQTVGIIGRNGSGKSTLLEIIADTLQASQGEVEVNGKVAALLELGAGFNPDFTGRENVLMNATIMGIPASVVDEKMSEILDFANIGEHIDYPVKTYSSGMYVRLAFATSIHMEPEILIVDEALAVGDLGFQRKCFREFEKLKAAGKTILFVTHAVDLVQTYCDSAVFLHQGEIRKQGAPREVVYDYLEMLFGADEVPPPSISEVAATMPQKGASTASDTPLGLNTDPRIDGAKNRRSYNAQEHRWGDQRAKIIDYLVEADGVVDPLVVEQGAEVRILMAVSYFDTLDRLIYGLAIKTLDGTQIYGVNTRARKQEVAAHEAGEVAVIEFRFSARLIQGSYFFSLGVALDCDEKDNLAIDRRYDLFSIAINAERQDLGLAQLDGEIKEL